MDDAEASYRYSALFYRYQREGSARSAAHVLPMLAAALSYHSVVDVGCGAGAWLSVHRNLGVDDLLGIDGAYLDRDLLMVDHALFRPVDIIKRFDLGRQFDLVQCLEVAEHVPAAASGWLIDNLVRHGRQVLFSAAVPGQGGEDHVNERPYEYWRDQFAARGYQAFDYLRPRLRDRFEIEPWYRYNLLLFVHESAIGSLSASLRATQIPLAGPIADVSPVGYRMRKLVLSRLPSPWVSRLAVWKHRRFVRALQRRRQTST